MSLSPGVRLGSYEITAAIGSGGMGEVYRARDMKLGRDVAIKVLPVSFATDERRLKRFEQEARTAGSLNHPSLVTVYELGVTDGAPYIVMEMVEGETLRQRLSPSTAAVHGLPIRKAIDCAVQIANGLAAAHERGIVHRDLKPENIIVMPDGRLKILDFGLAKATLLGGEGVSDYGTVTSPPMTDAGSVLGTIGYMSPEQVRGTASIDHRADLFALGAILYELLTGRRAFQAGSAVETMNAILHDDPADVARESAEIPMALVRVVQRCLEKDPAERFQSARDLGFHLSALAGDSGQRSGAVTAGRPQWSRRISRAAVGVVGALAGLALGWVFLRQPPLEPVSLETFTYSGSDNSPAVSPDGKTIAFSSSRNGKRQIWLKQISGGGETARTGGPEDNRPRFSPDGTSILFLRAENGQVNLYRTAVLGGEERRVLSDDVTAADWSPNSAAIVFATRSAQPEIVIGIVQADGSGRRDLHTVSGWRTGGVAWAPDGASIAAVFLPSIGTTAAQLKLIPVGSGETRTLHDPAASSISSAPVWSASGELVYATPPSGRVRRFGDRGYRVVAHDTQTDRVRTLFWTFAAPGAMDVVAPGTLVFDGVLFSQKLRSVPLGPAGEPQKWLTRGSSIDRQPALSPDNNSVIFASNRSRNLDLWVLSRDDGSLRRLTDDAAADWDPAFTPDGKNILWSSNRSGHFEIWMAATDGSGARQISQDGVDAQNPSMTPDGEWVVYWSSNGEKRGIWKVRPDGTEATQIVKGLYLQPEISPNGRYVAMQAAPQGDRRPLVVYRIDDGAAVPFSILVDRNGSVDPNYGRLRWMPNGNAIAFVASGPDGVTGVFVQDFVPGQDTTATRRKLAGFVPDSPVESFGIAPNGSVVVMSFAENTSDLVLAYGIPNLLPLQGKR